MEMEIKPDAKGMEMRNEFRRIRCPSEWAGWLTLFD